MSRAKREEARPAPAEASDLLPAIHASLLREVSDLVKVAVEALDIDSELSEYGFDSISFTTLAHRLNQLYGLELMPTIFFEHPTVGEFARYLVEHHREVFAASFAPAAKPVPAESERAGCEGVGEARPRRERRGRFAARTLVESERAKSTAEPALPDDRLR